MGRRRKRRFGAKSASTAPEVSSAAAPTDQPEVAMSSAAIGRRQKRAITDYPTEGAKRQRMEQPDDDDTEQEEDTQRDTERDKAGGKEAEESANAGEKGDDDVNTTGSTNPSVPVGEAECRAGKGEDGGSRGSHASAASASSSADESIILVTCGRNEGRLYLSKLRVVVNERCRSKCIRTGNAWWTPNEFQFVSGRGAAKDWKRTVKHAGQCLKALMTNGTLCLASVPPKCLCKGCSAKSSSGGGGGGGGGGAAAGRAAFASGKRQPPSDPGDAEEAEKEEEDADQPLLPGLSTSELPHKVIKKQGRIKRSIRGAGAGAGAVSLAARRKDSYPDRKGQRSFAHSKPEVNSDSTLSLSGDCASSSSLKRDVTDQEDPGSSCQGAAEAKTPLGGERRRPGRPKKKVAPPQPLPSQKTVFAEPDAGDGGPSTVDEFDPDEQKVKDRSPRDAGCPDDVASGVRCSSQDVVAAPAAAAAFLESDPASKSSENRLSGSGSVLDDIPADQCNRSSCLSNDPAADAEHLKTDAPAADVIALAPGDDDDDDDEDKHPVAAFALDPPPFTVPASAAEVVSDRQKAEGEVLPVDVAKPDVSISGSDADDASSLTSHERLMNRNDDVTGDEAAKADVTQEVPSDDVNNPSSSLSASVSSGPRKSAYLNAVIAELKRKKISRETGVGAGPPVAGRCTPTTTTTTMEMMTTTTTQSSSATVGQIKSETKPEVPRLDWKPVHDEIRAASASAAASDQSSSLILDHVTSSVATDSKPSHSKSTRVRDSGSSARSAGRRSTTDCRARVQTPRFQPPPGVADWQSSLASLMGTCDGKESKGLGRCSPPVEARVGGATAAAAVIGGKLENASKERCASAENIASHLGGISQLASIYGFTPSQLASLPFPSNQFPLFPPYLFMGFPLQPLLPQYPSSASVSLPSSSSSASCSASLSSPHLSASAAASVSAASQSRRRREGGHHKASPSSAAKDRRIQQPPSASAGTAGRFAAFRNSSAEALPSVSYSSSSSIPMLTDMHQWRFIPPGISAHEWLADASHPSKAGAPAAGKFCAVDPTGSASSRDRSPIWRPAIASHASAKEATISYRPSAHASPEVETFRRYGRDSQATGNAYKTDVAIPIDFTRRMSSSKKEEQERFSSASRTGSDADRYPCDEQGVLDLSKK